MAVRLKAADCIQTNVGSRSRFFSDYRCLFWASKTLTTGNLIGHPSLVVDRPCLEGILVERISRAEVYGPKLAPLSSISGHICRPSGVVFVLICWSCVRTG